MVHAKTVQGYVEMRSFLGLWLFDFMFGSVFLYLRPVIYCIAGHSNIQFHVCNINYISQGIFIISSFAEIIAIKDNDIITIIIIMRLK